MELIGKLCVARFWGKSFESSLRSGICRWSCSPMTFCLEPSFALATASGEGWLGWLIPDAKLLVALLKQEEIHTKSLILSSLIILALQVPMRIKN